MAIVAAVRTTLINAVTVRHVNAPFFLVLKWAAFCDRGQGAMLASTDIEDFVALLASRPTLPDEIAAMPVEARRYLGTAARAILDDPDSNDLLNAHLNNADPRAVVVERVRRILRAMAAGGRGAAEP